MLSLDTLAGGALAEEFEYSLTRVLQNLKDVNTPYKDKRKINISLVFSQNEERDDVHIDVVVSEKLAPAKPIETQMYIERDFDTGQILSEEYGKGVMKGQMHIDDLTKEPTVLPEKDADAEKPLSFRKVIGK